LLVSIVECIGVHTMGPRRQAQAITQPPADVHTGTQVFAVVGTDEQGVT
jgi:hypothetical protein